MKVKIQTDKLNRMSDLVAVNEIKSLLSDERHTRKSYYDNNEDCLEEVKKFLNVEEDVVRKYPKDVKKALLDKYSSYERVSTRIDIETRITILNMIADTYKKYEKYFS